MYWETNDEVSMNQAVLADKLPQQTEKENYRPLDSPMMPTILYKDWLNASRLSAEEHYRCRSIVRTLMHLAIMTRPELCVPTSILGLRVAEPSTLDIQTAEKGSTLFKGNNGISKEIESGYK